MLGSGGYPALVSREIAVGAWLGSYQVTREIARGGQGAVFEGRHRESGARVALKVLLDRDPAQLGRFLQEAQVLSRLRHPHLPLISEIEARGPAPYFAMELIEGRDLADRVLQAGLPDRAWIVRVLAPIARAIHYCHEQGIVHRDLKPRNILVEAETGRPVLADFGLVQRDSSQMGLQTVDGLGRLSTTNEVMGTPSYMAPEQADGETFGGIGPHTDVYALGATLFYLLTGKPPQEGSSLVNILVKLLKRTEPPDPRAKNPSADRALSELCRSCLRTHSTERPPTALAVAEALEAINADPKPRNPLRFVALGLGLLVLAGGGAALAVASQTGASPPATVSAPEVPVGPRALLVLSVDADRVEVLSGEVVLGKASPTTPLRLELNAGKQSLSLRRLGASIPLELDLAEGQTAHSCQLNVSLFLEAGTAAQATVYPAGRDAPARDSTGQVLREIQLPLDLSLPLGRYRISLKAADHHPKSVEFVARPGGPSPRLQLTGEIRWRRDYDGTLWNSHFGEDLDGDGTRDLVVHWVDREETQRLLALSGVDGGQLWENDPQVNLWSGSLIQQRPERAILAIRGTSPQVSELLWLDPATGRELREPFRFEASNSEKVTLSGLAGIAGGQGGVLTTEHWQDNTSPGRSLVRLGPKGRERSRVSLIDLGLEPRKNTRSSYPAVFDASGQGVKDAVLWRYHRTYFFLDLNHGSRVLATRPPPARSVEAKTYRGWWAVGDTIPRVEPGGKAAVLSWIGREGGKIRSHLSLVDTKLEDRWSVTFDGYYYQGAWLDLRGGRVFAAVVLPKRERSLAQLRLLDPETGEILRKTDIEAGLIAAPKLLRSRAGLESLVLSTYKPSLVQLLDPVTFRPRWQQGFRNTNERHRGKQNLRFEVNSAVADLDQDGAEELVVTRCWDGELVVVDPLFRRR